MDNIPVEHRFALSYEHQELTDAMLQALKEYHSEEVAEFGEDVENNYDKWLNNQSQMDIDYILEKYSYED